MEINHKEKDLEIAVREGTYFVTGITGFIGSVIMKYLMETKQYANGKIKIIGLARNSEKIQSVYCNYNLNNVKIIEADMNDLPQSLIQYKSGIDYIIHCAANTKSAEIISKPVETIEGIVLGTRNILEVAKINQIESMVFLSSMEIYGDIDLLEERVTEEQLGFLEILSVRNSYPNAKRIAENLCYAYYTEYKVPIKIARLAQTFGKGTLAGDTRIFGQIADCVLKENKFKLYTTGESVGNYVETEDAIRGIFLLLNKGVDGEAYNIVNEENTMTILEMVQIVCNKLSNNKMGVEFDINLQNTHGYANPTQLRMSSKKIEELGWEPRYNIEHMFERMINDIKEKG